MTPEREHRIRQVISRRQYDLTVVLENVHDPHNIGAIMRSCDSVGISEIFVLYTEPELIDRGFQAGHKSSSGSRRWVEVKYYTDTETCFEEVRKRYRKIYGTVISEGSDSLYDLDLVTSCALLFGNEHDGISQEARQYIDSNFIIPQMGFVCSLNISVACAVSLYEAFRQRESSGHYGRNFGDDRRDHDLYVKYAGVKGLDPEKKPGG